MVRARSGEEILLRNRIRQPGVVLDERGNELVQPALEDLGHARALELGVHRARLALGDAAASVVARQAVERAVDALVAGYQRARHRALQDEQVGDEPGLDAVA